MMNTEIKEEEKREYIVPIIKVEIVELEQGICAGSASVTPGMTGGNVDPIATDWEDNDDTSIDSPF